METDTSLHPIQVKVCGLTRIDEALACADLGVHAIGAVFFHRSPRDISVDQAAAIRKALPPEVKYVGVFVDETFSGIIKKVDHCGLDAVQLHGRESPELVDRLVSEGLNVIKALFAKRAPFFPEASDFKASSFLVECGKGVLPGGNAETWQWEQAREVGDNHPLVLAGGLSPDNVARAIADARPDAVDVSSGVEASPGRKDPEKVRAFMGAITGTYPKVSSQNRIF